MTEREWVAYQAGYDWGNGGMPMQIEFPDPNLQAHFEKGWKDATDE